MRAYLQRIMGYTLTGLTSAQAMFFHWGTGANGKSVFHEVCKAVLGSYAQVVPVETLLASRSEGRIPNDVARMKGRRYLLASETKAGHVMDEQKIKQLTGGDTVSARFMRGEFFDFQPTGKIHLASNHLLRMTEDRATWRRLHLIRWETFIPDEERDGELADKIIKDELAGVLAWLVRGAIAWHERGLQPPGKAEDDKQEYRESEDVLQMCIDDMLVREPGGKAGDPGRSSQEISTAVASWYRQNGHAVLSQKTLTSRLKERGFAYQSSNGWRGFTDLRVRAAAGTG
jgi:putative DNA primase/helicase